jgi:hypothetical protein
LQGSACGRGWHGAEGGAFRHLILGPVVKGSCVGGIGMVLVGACIG